MDKKHDVSMVRVTCTTSRPFSRAFGEVRASGANCHPAGRRARPGGPRCRTCRGPTRALRILRLREDSAAASVREIDWLHTHVPDGVIHIESPVRRGFTLGDFFDEWGLPLSTDQVGPAKGRVTAFYDGKVYQGNPRDIPLVDKA
jgi:hypothetical protein